MIRYRYSLWSASDVGENRHPQIVILEVAPDATDFHPAPIADCWLFSSSEIAELPSYIERVRITRVEHFDLGGEA